MHACRQLIMSRGHTVAAPTDHIERGGKAWDTVKPLHTWFKDLRKVILVDDDAFKVTCVIQVWHKHPCAGFRAALLPCLSLLKSPVGEL